LYDHVLLLVFVFTSIEALNGSKLGFRFTTESISWPTCRFVESAESSSRVSAMVLRSPGGDHESVSSPYRHVEADTPKSVISADRFLVACGTRPVR